MGQIVGGLIIFAVANFAGLARPDEASSSASVALQCMNGASMQLRDVGLNYGIVEVGIFLKTVCQLLKLTLCLLLAMFLAHILGIYSNDEPAPDVASRFVCS
jgi:hypothetical protein